MTNNLEKYFTKTEQEIVEKKIESDINLKEKYDKIKNNPEYRLSELEEKTLKTEENFKKRFEAFKKAVLEAEKNQSPVEKVKQKADKLVDETVENAKSWMLNWIEEKVPWAKKVLEFFDKIWKVWDKAWDIYEKKWFIAAAGVIFWLFTWKVTFDSLFKKETKETKDGEEIVESDDEKTPKKANKETEKKAPVLDQKEQLKRSENNYFKFWKLFVKKFWYEEFSSKNNFWIITDRLKKKKYSDLKYYTFNDYKKENKLDNLKWNKLKEEKENFGKVKNNLLWNDMLIFFSSVIKKEKVEELYKVKKFKNILVDLWIDKENLNWENLSLEKIFILFSLIISTEVILWLKSIPWIWKNIFDKFLEMKENFPWYNEIKNDLKELEKEYQKEVMPEELIKKLFKLGNIWESYSYNCKIENKTDNIFYNFSDEEKKYIQKVLDFKEKFNKNILNNEKYTFNDKMKIWLEKQINFKDILSLYLSTKWKIKENDSIFNVKVRWLLIIISRRNNEEGKYWIQFNNYIKKLSSKEEKNPELLSKLIIEKIIEKGVIDNIKDNAEKAWNWLLEIAKNHPVETGVWAVLLSLLWKTYWKTIMKLRTLMYIWWASALAYWYYQLKINWVENKDLKTVREWLETIWVNGNVLDNIDNWEEYTNGDYNKIIENDYNVIDKQKLETNLWTFNIKNNELFFTDKKNNKYKLNFENDIHSLSNLLWYDFWKDISKWVFSIKNINFVKKWEKYFINVNNDYFLDLNTIQQDWDKYKISIWENSQENVINDISSAKDFILDWFYFEKIK